uniref:Chorein N-terminal domain-containing protein n=1 Tax=Panagrolaimus superbus TaxID=310955 RepID=A0A914YYG8_9BILA
MVSIIKNQIIKHLSIFAKNLKPEQISLEVLGGTGELRNIVLNEAVLTEKLELPPFLKLKNAECNRIKVKVPWTKLSTCPVEIIVDELHVVLQLGHAKAADPPKKSSGSNSYGFADKVVEGLSIKINVLDVSFESDSFSGSIWLSPLIVESKSPIWQDVTNLKRSRISDSSCHQVIFFKQVSWNLMKIQAFAHGKDSSDRGQRLNSPLRLITQGGKCRIAIKKDSHDGSLLAGRIQTIFDEIHWVATLAEVRSAIAFYKHILTLAKASSTHASENPFLVDYSAKSRSKQQTLPNPAIKSTIFKQFDLGQTSHHVYINKVHMTLIDDHNNEMDYPSNWNTKSGAIQVTLEKITIDYYLQNLISDERRFWVRYNAPNEFTNFANGELLRHLTFLSQGLDPNARERLSRLWSTLTSETLVVRIDDIVVECVSEQTTKRDDLQDAYSSKINSKLPLPQSLPAFHFEFSNYLFPGSTTPESPKPLAHIVVGPANILLDPRTIRWLLYVVDNITRSIDINESQNDVQVVCARIDLVMPKLIIPCPVIEEDCRYPQKFVVNVSTVTISNRALDNETFSVENLFQQLTDENIQFITEIGGDLQDLRNHVLQAKQLAAELATNGASLDLLQTRWYISTSPLWMEAIISVPNFTGKVLTGPTVISDVMLAGCIEVKSPNIYIAVEPLNSLTIIIDHFQFVQLMRIQKSISNLVEQLELDKQFFSKLSSIQSENSPLSLYCFCDEINAHLILPTGIAPSPYDLVYSFPKSETDTSISSGWFIIRT